MMKAIQKITLCNVHTLFSLFVFLSVPTSSLLSPCRLNNDFIIPVLGRDSTNDIYIKYSKVLGFCLVLKILSYLNEMPYLILHLLNQVMICILFLLLICWKKFPESNFPWKLPTPKKFTLNHLYCLCKRHQIIIQFTQ